MSTNAVEKESLGKAGGVYADSSSLTVSNPTGFAWLQILEDTVFDTITTPNVDLMGGLDPTNTTFSAGSVILHPVTRFRVQSGVVFAANAYSGLVGIVAQTDPDAAAYIAAIEGDGVVVSETQRNAINTFYTTGKSEGWYSKFSRFYLPIWGSAAPNSRCLVSETSGTFNGNVTQGSGFIARADSTGFFDTSANAASLTGVDNDSGWLGVLVKTATGNDQYLGAQSGTNLFLLRSIRGGGGSITSEIMSSAGGRFDTSSGGNAGIISARRLSGTRANMKRTSSARSVLGSSTDASEGTPPSFSMYALQKNNAGAPSAGEGSEIGAFWFGQGVTDQQDSDCTAAIETLWETCTGLSLP